ncbi:MAG: hypothetical protein ACOX0A_02165 [Thermoguttaceae bacterium]|jgi:hypothetical protein
MKNEHLTNLLHYSTVSAGRRIAQIAVVLSLLLLTGLPEALGSDEQIVKIQVASDSQNEGYEARKAFDGDPKTFWHSQFSQAPFEQAAIPIRCGYATGCIDDHPSGFCRVNIARISLSSFESIWATFMS